jgi:hypothetical protein
MMNESPMVRLMRWLPCHQVLEQLRELVARGCRLSAEIDDSGPEVVEAAISHFGSFACARRPWARQVVPGVRRFARLQTDSRCDRTDAWEERAEQVLFYPPAPRARLLASGRGYRRADARRISGAS